MKKEETRSPTRAHDCDSAKHNGRLFFTFSKRFLNHRTFQLFFRFVTGFAFNMGEHHANVRLQFCPVLFWRSSRLKECRKLGHGRNVRLLLKADKIIAQHDPTGSPGVDRTEWNILQHDANLSFIFFFNATPWRVRVIFKRWPPQHFVKVAHMRA